ncbi:MAG TPA: BTAD domain-containing putative transcriptional regulator [Micromonosporaceae bacterium]|nr:BTAD domain-containing putative transcriptional regulator [Micromonosporaceae bacterium]
MKQRILLTALLLDANSVVSLDRLVWTLWGEASPPSAIANVRTYISRLRHLLTDHTGQSRVSGRAPGYLVHIAEDELDLEVFGRRVDAARGALADGQTERAATQFEQALALWYGMAAEDIPRSLTGLGARLAALDEQRLTTIEDWVDARLKLGEHTRVVAELRQLTSQHPLRERLWSLLMLSLYGAGDVGGALAAYGEARHTLAEELGVDPGPELTRLHLAVLARDPAILAAAPPTGRPTTLMADQPAARAPTPAWPVPHELPTDLTTLVGREHALATVIQTVQATPGPCVVAIHGAGGVGKSALAVHASHLLAAEFPDGQIYVELHGATVGLPPARPVDVLGRFLRALGVPGDQVPADCAEAAARYRSLAADRRLIVVLDNAADETQVRPLLSAASGCAVIITSRRMLAALDGATHLELGPLSQDAAVILLRRLVGVDRVAAEPEQASRLASLCDRLPLALRIVGARLARRPQWPLAELAEQLTDERSRLDTLSFADLAVRSSLDVSCRDLSVRGADPAHSLRLFRLLGLLRVHWVSPPLAAALLDEANSVADAALDRLIGARLMEQLGPDRYRMHDLVRIYAADLAATQEPITRRDEALERVLAHYLSTARRAVDLLRPVHRRGDDEFAEPFVRIDFPDPAAAIAWLENERVNMVAVARQVVDSPAAARFVLRLFVVLYQYLATHAYWDDMAELGAMSLAVAARLNDRHSEAVGLIGLALVCREQGRPGEALSHLQRAMEIRQADGDRKGLASCLSHLGLTYFQAGDPQTALACLEESIARHRELGLTLGEGIACNDAADVLCHLDRYKEAGDYLSTALAIRRATNDRIGEAITLVGMGKVAVLIGRPANAVPLLTQALRQCRAAGVRTYEWRALLWRADTYRRLNRLPEATGDLEEALRLCRFQHDRRGEGLTAQLLGRVWDERGRPGKAGEHRAQARSLLAQARPRTGDDLALLFGEAATGTAGELTV